MDELKEKARQAEEERRKIQIENEKQLDDLIKEISSQINEGNTVTKSEYQNATEPESEIVIDEDDPLLKKIINRNLNTVPSLLSPLNPLDVELINYFNLNEDTANSKSSEEDEFQLIEGDDATDMVVLRSNLNVSDSDVTANALSSDFNTLKRSNRTVTTNNLINITLNDIECQNKRIQAAEVTEHPISEHNSDMVIAALANQLVETVIKNALEINGKDGANIQPESEALANFNDSNDLSMSIEVEQLTNPDDSKQQGCLSISNTCKSRIDSSTIEEDECNDSDIEVLSVSSKFVKNLIELAKINIEQESHINSDSTALLDSISEQLAETEPDKLAKLTNSTEEAAFIKNYDLVSFETSQILEKCKLLRTIESDKCVKLKKSECGDLIALNQSLSENNFIFSSSPLNQFTEQLFE